MPLQFGEVSFRLPKILSSLSLAFCFPSGRSHTLSFLQRRRHDKTQIREARLEHERLHLAEIRRKQAFPCCLHPNRPQTLWVVPETCPLILPYFFFWRGIMELKREWMGRSEELRESVLVQMFSTRNEFGRIRLIVRVTLIFEETKQEFFKDYLFEGWKANPARNTSPVEVAEPAYINEVHKALKGGYRKVYSSLDSLRAERGLLTEEERRNKAGDRSTLPKKVSVLSRGTVSLDTMRAWKREMDYVYAGGEFA